MRQRSTGNKGGKLRRRKSSTRRNARKTRRGNSSVAAAKETDVARLTRELNAALEQQAATAEILDVISNSPTDTQPVFDAIVQSGLRLFPGALISVALRYGDMINAAAVAAPDLARVEAWRRTISRTPLARGYMHGAALLDRKVVDIPDVADAPAEFVTGAQNFLTSGNRAITIMPMMLGDEAIGLLSVVRLVAGPLSDRQLAVLKTFAAQAVIAIENTRVLSELRQRTEDLSESLQQQTTTADVLKVISRSTFDLQTVFDTLVKSAARLCVAECAFIFQLKDEFYHLVANQGFDQEFQDFIRQNPIAPGRTGTLVGQVTLEGRTVHIPDAATDPNYTWSESQKRGGFRTMLGIPLLREGVPIGVIALTRSEPRPFTDKQIELVSTFADQAMIAIENVRLFEEVQKRTEDLRESLQQQTATADVLKVISRSAFDLQTVLHTLVKSAAELSEADSAMITRQDSEGFVRSEAYGLPPDVLKVVKGSRVVPDRSSAAGRALLEGNVVHIPDVRADPEYTFSNDLNVLNELRTTLGIPMLREGIPIGVVTLSRSEMRPFNHKQIELVKTFADQAAIAIENSRLFEQVQERTKELSASLDDLRAAQDRLVQTEKLASLGQLTAGIAHEIKNPLNFVNNFSGVSTELIDELRNVLSGVSIDEKARTEVDQLTHTLRGNLDKVVQHGKRADAIVKNMLMHSREGSGEHRPVDINAVVEESLNLAYHGARAEKHGFNITLEKALDPAAGEIDLFPQEITRVLLNLISNGFYAATKRKADGNGGGAFEPTLLAATKNLGDSVEITIRDNGTGVPPEVREKMFNPFFTTKPPGEGTGLGLSISHDIIVKQHGGTIEVDTQPGTFTEVRIVLPRTVAPIGSGRA